MAVTDDVGWVNLALARLGQGQLSTIDDNTRDGKIAKLSYEDTRNEVMRSFAWSCLITRADLVANVGTNDTEFQYMYDKPSDFIRALEIEGDPDIPFRIEGALIYTDQATANLRYVKKDTTVTNWDPLLLEAIVLRLATKMCYRVTQSIQLMTILAQEYILTITTAVRTALVEQKEEAMELIQYLQENSPLMLANRNFVSE